MTNHDFPLELFKIICWIRESFARIHQGEFPDTKDIATYIANVDITRLRYFNYIQRSRWSGRVSNDFPIKII